MGMANLVVRIDNPKSYQHGWQARLWSGTEWYRSKFFADKKHGGKRKAKKLAEAYLDKYKDKMPRELRIRTQRTKRQGRAHGLGVTYVEKQKRAGGVYMYWQASWYDRDKKYQVRRQFNIETYGFDQAYDLAFEARKKAIKGKGKYRIAAEQFPE